MIDATPLAGTLYQGGRPPIGPELARAGFKLLVLCAQEIQPAAQLFPGVSVIRAPNDDANRPPSPMEQDIANRAAAAVALALARGLPVLVTCAMGLNRSGLVSATALHRLTGRSGAECLEIVRSARPGALTNPHFARLLRAMPARNPWVLEGGALRRSTCAGCLPVPASAPRVLAVDPVAGPIGLPPATVARMQLEAGLPSAAAYTLAAGSRGRR